MMATKSVCPGNSKPQGLSTSWSTFKNKFEGSYLLGSPEGLFTTSHSADSVVSPTGVQRSLYLTSKSRSASLDSAYISMIRDTDSTNSTYNSNTFNQQCRISRTESPSGNRHYVMYERHQPSPYSETSTLSSDTISCRLSKHRSPPRGIRFHKQNRNVGHSFLVSVSDSNEDDRKPNCPSPQSPSMFIMSPQTNRVSRGGSQENRLQRRASLESSCITKIKQEYKPILHISQLRKHPFRNFQRSRKSSPDESSEIYSLSDGFEKYDATKQHPTYAFGNGSKSYTCPSVSCHQLQPRIGYKKSPCDQECKETRYGNFPQESPVIYKSGPEVSRRSQMIQYSQYGKFFSNPKSKEMRLLNGAGQERIKHIGDAWDRHLENELESSGTYSISNTEKHEKICKQIQNRPSRRTRRSLPKQNDCQKGIRNNMMGGLASLQQNTVMVDEDLSKKTKTVQESTALELQSRTEKHTFHRETSHPKRSDFSTKAAELRHWIPGPRPLDNRFRGGSPHPDTDRMQWQKHLPPRGDMGRSPTKATMLHTTPKNKQLSLGKSVRLCTGSQERKSGFQKSPGGAKMDLFAAWELSEHERMQSRRTDYVDDLKIALSKSCPHTFGNSGDISLSWNDYSSESKISKAASKEDISQDLSESEMHLELERGGEGNCVKVSKKACESDTTSEGFDESSLTSSICSNISSDVDEEKTSVSSEWDSQRHKKLEERDQHCNQRETRNHQEKSDQSQRKIITAKPPKQGQNSEPKRWLRSEEENSKSEQQKSVISLQQHREQQKQWQRKILQHHKKLKQKREGQQQQLQCPPTQTDSKLPTGSYQTEERQNQTTVEQLGPQFWPQKDDGLLPENARFSKTEIAETKITKLATIEERSTSMASTDTAQPLDNHKSKTDPPSQLKRTKRLLKRSLSMPEGSFKFAMSKRIRFSSPRSTQRTFKSLKKQKSNPALKVVHTEISKRKDEHCQHRTGRTHPKPESTRSIKKLTRKRLAKKCVGQPSKSSKPLQKATIGDWKWRLFLSSSGATFMMCVAVAYLVTKIQ